ncbi:MAG: hypothetical protein HY370_08610 [Proteobacteria bacterium]|nr:hypothetical protein [Pseudomonadota bacterium]
MEGVASATPPETAQEGEPATIDPLYAAPPGAGDRPPDPGQIGTAYTPNGLPALQPMGVNVDTLFSENIRDEDKRFERLENAVLEMRKEFETVKPSIVRLVAVESDMQDLLTQLETLLRNEPPPTAAIGMEEKSVPGSIPYGAAERPAPGDEPRPPASTGPPLPVTAAAQPPSAYETGGKTAQAPPPSPAPQQPAAKAQGPPQITALRLGEHADKTRLVLDSSGPAKYRYDLDNGEHLLIVELPGTGWAAQKQGTTGKAPLVGSWAAQPMDGGAGTRLIVQLKHESAVIYESALAGSGGSGARIVIDLKSPEVHR